MNEPSRRGRGALRVERRPRPRSNAPSRRHLDVTDAAAALKARGGALYYPDASPESKVEEKQAEKDLRLSKKSKNDPFARREVDPISLRTLVNIHRHVPSLVSHGTQTAGGQR